MKSFVTGRVRQTMSSLRPFCVDLCRRAAAGRPIFALGWISTDVTETKKFRGLRKKSSTPNLKYFGFHSLLSLPAVRGVTENP